MSFKAILPQSSVFFFICCTKVIRTVELRSGHKYCLKSNPSGQAIKQSDGNLCKTEILVGSVLHVFYCVSSHVLKYKVSQFRFIAAYEILDLLRLTSTFFTRLKVGRFFEPRITKDY